MSWRVLLPLVGLTVLLLGYPAQLLAANTDVNVRVCPATPYPPPTITAPTNGTRTAQSSILMSGQATPDVPVYAYRNDVQVGFVMSGGGGDYVISVSLDMGTNILKASTNNECSAPAFSASVSVEREAAPVPPTPPPPPAPDDGDGSVGEPGPSDGPAAGSPPTSPPTGAPPTISQPGQPGPIPAQPPETSRRPVIHQPKNGRQVDYPFILVVGEASPNTRVRILRNGQVVAEVLTDSEGRFTVGVPLEPGQNHLVAVTGQGSEERFSEEVVITYQPAEAARSLFHSPFFCLGLAGFIILLMLLYTLIRRRRRSKDVNDTNQP